MWPSFREAIAVSCLVHGLCASLIGVRLEAVRAHTPGPIVSAFLGSVLGSDDVRRRSGPKEQGEVLGAEQARRFTFKPGRPDVGDYRPALPAARKPARARAQALAPPPTVVEAGWSSPRQEVIFSVEAPEVEGALRARRILYMPPVPRAPGWMQPIAVETIVAARIWVVPAGQIRRVEPLVSSGDPSMDLILLRYLRSWIFAPRPGAKEVETGIVRLRFRPR